MTDSTPQQPDLDEAELTEIIYNAEAVIRGEHGLENHLAALLEEPLSETRAQQVSDYLSGEQMRRARSAAHNLAGTDGDHS
ncbi:MAG: hypothetical protein ACTII7_09705 [Galactobacter sp.]